MLGINESTIEQSAIATMQSLGWDYTYGKTILLGCQNEWRERTGEVILKPLLAAAIAKLNPNLPAAEVENVVAMVCRADTGDLAERNRGAYEWLRNGVPYRYQAQGEQKFEVVRLVDFGVPAHNDFRIVNQLDIGGKKGKRIPDLIGFVNGLPLVVFELKNPLKENADIGKAYAQLQTYKEELAELFVFNQALVISDGIVARIGSLTADFERFTPWRVVDEKNKSQRIVFENELEGLLTGLMTPKNLLDYVQNFVVFERDNKNRTIKKIGAYHQFYGVNEAVECTLLASSHTGNRKVGVFWHTQGSGKSLSMLFYAGKVLSQGSLKNPTLVLVTDRNDLDGQLYATFCGGEALLKQTPIQVDGRDELRSALASRSAGGVIFTTIQKFGLMEDELSHPILNERQNIIVITDEAHRSQYGFSQKINDKGQYREGYAKHLRSALPNASFIGFTGTPIALDDKDTQEVFGKYVSIYDFEDAVKDGATVPIIYEPRQISLGESHDFNKVVKEAQTLLDDDEQNPTFRLREKLHGVESRLQKMAEDIIAHYDERTKQQDGKAMVVVMSRAICVKLYEKIIAIRPDWHSDDVLQGVIKIVMTSNASDPAEWQKYNQDKKTLEKRFKDPDDPLKIVIVRDMWLTGFDAPCCNTMYIDKPMSGHNLMQAIARVNRVFRNKSMDNGGLIVDYVGLTDELEKAMKQYTNAGGKEKPVRNIETVLEKMLEYVSIIRGQFATPVDGQTVDIGKILQISEPAKLLNAILTSANHILALDRVNPHDDTDKQDKTPRKNAFLQAVRFAKKGFSLCGALKDVEPYKQELAFYDAVRATIIKNSTASRNPSGKDRLLQLTVLMNRAVQSDGVVDLFDLLKKERPNINLLSDEFLETVKNSPTKDLWLLAMERFLSSELKEKGGVNLATKKEFEERLKEAMNQYHNHNLSVLEIIEELIALAKEFEARQKRGEELGLSPAEMAFYDALARNESAVREMGDAVLLKLAREITEKLRKSVTIDWQYKDSVRAKMRTLIRITLRTYKYPPDLQNEAIEFVLKQAEEIAEDLVPKETA
ncbi:type I restriction endonuclease subunit R [Suttonella indologenes]|uniref:Type I restriction enzyme endonuclease subunit n=1 Tax=Suttonella indologenes TaxID=13276 RepID=A0A380MYF1_9GAMM|nr:type I restriction endonuclease subunit R [Suttonella indologenes]SUO97318.1 Type-1 restriction enzyme R protein [Suttonella indologenes]